MISSRVNFYSSARYRFVNSDYLGPPPKLVQVNAALGLGQEIPADDSMNFLTLNIWTPGISDTARLPVLVYICGGGFFAGDGSDELYRCHNLAAKGVVAITLNYRVSFVRASTQKAVITTQHA